MENLPAIAVEIAVISGVMIYGGKLIVDRLLERSKELEALKFLSITKTSEANEKALSGMRTQTAKLADSITEMKIELIKMQAKVEATKESQLALIEAVQTSLKRTEDFMAQIKKSEIIELGEKYKMIKNKKDK